MVEAREPYVNHYWAAVKKVESPNGVRRSGRGRSREQHRSAFHTNRK
jgi:hypothetical protein